LGYIARLLPIPLEDLLSLWQEKSGEKFGISRHMGELPGERLKNQGENPGEVLG